MRAPPADRGSAVAAQEHTRNPIGADWAMVLVTTGLVVVAAVQAGLFVWQLLVMRRSLDAAKAAADAAAVSADVSRSAMHVANRAHLYVDHFRVVDFLPGQVPTVGYDVLNSGHTAATLISMSSTYSDDGLPPAAPDHPSPAQPKHGVIRPSTVGMDFTVPFSQPLEEDFYEGVVMSGERGVYVWGELTYADIFGQRHKLAYGVQLQTPNGGKTWVAYPIDLPGFNYVE